MELCTCSKCITCQVSGPNGEAQSGRFLSRQSITRHRISDLSTPVNFNPSPEESTGTSSEESSEESISQANDTFEGLDEDDNRLIGMTLSIFEIVTRSNANS